MPSSFRDADHHRGRSTAWKAVSTLASIGAGVLTRSLLTKVWSSWTGDDPPENPADHTVTWRDALLWSAGVGVTVGVARMLGQRTAASAWAAATGEPPPGTSVAVPESRA